MSEQDSTKLVEHIRLVHFWVVVVSVGILALVSLDTRDRYTYALEQLAEIRRVIDAWDVDWLNRAAAAAAAPASERAADDTQLLRQRVVTSPFQTKDGREIVLSISLRGDRLFRSEDEYLTTQLRRPLGERKPHLAGAEVPPWAALHDLSLSRPTSLGQFVGAWDGLAQPHAVGAFELIYDVVRIQIAPVPVNGDGDEQQLDTYFTWRKLHLVSGPSSPETHQLVLYPKEIDDLTKKEIDKIGRAGCVNYAFSSGQSGFSERAPLSTTYDYGPVLIPACVNYIPMDARSQFVQQYKVKWRTVPFAEQFPELAELSADLHSLPLDLLEKQIRQERERAREKLTVFSITLPAESLSRWGIAALLLLQVYLLLHLTSLAARLRPGDLGFVVPWTGVYPSVFGIVATLSSATSLPVLCTVLVSLGIIRDTLAIDRYGVFLSVASVVVGCYTGWYLWLVWTAARVSQRVARSNNGMQRTRRRTGLSSSKFRARR